MKFSYNYRENIINNNTIFPFYVYPFRSENATLHWHNEFEILYFTCDGTIGIDRNSINVCKNDIFFINKEQLHSPRIFSNKLCYAFAFPFNFLSFEKKDSCQEIINDLISGKLWFPMKLSPNDNLYESVHKNIIDIIEVYNTDYIGKELKIKISLYNIILAIYHENRFIVQNNKSTPIDRHLDYVRTSMKYMEDNYNSNITIDILAKNVNISSYYLIKIFKQIAAVTPIEYLINIRLENAALLLRNSNNSIEHNAYKVGFNNMGYFVRKFKKKYNVTPNQYKQNYRYSNIEIERVIIPSK